LCLTEARGQANRKKSAGPQNKTTKSQIPFLGEDEKEDLVLDGSREGRRKVHTRREGAYNDKRQKKKEGRVHDPTELVHTPREPNEKRDSPRS